jgi:aspartate-semialdehyde dehydrogenase
MSTDLTIAVAGATGAVGGEVVKLLDASRWRPSRLLALARASTATTHVEYGGERVPVDDGSADLDGADALVVAVPTAAGAELVARGAQHGLPTIDLSGATAMDLAVPLCVPWVNPEALADAPRQVVAVPDAAATLVASILGPLRRAGLGVAAEATILAPASREGRAGIDELSRQVVALFNSQSPPRKVFKEGLAFDLLPAVGAPDADGWTDVERRVAAQVQRLVGAEVEATVVGVPVFSGVSVSLGLHLDRAVPLDLLGRILGDGGVRLPEAAGTRYLPRPRRVEGHPFAHVGRIRIGADGRRVVVWASLDNLRSTAAAAVAALATLLRVDRGEA